MSSTLFGINLIFASLLEDKIESLIGIAKKHKKQCNQNK